MPTTTYKPLATTTIGSAVSSYTFTSISGSYKDLEIVFNGIVSAATNTDLYLQFNSDTGSNYSRTVIGGDGAVQNSRASNQTYIRLTYAGSISSVYSSHKIMVMNYSNTNTYKTLLYRNAGTLTTGLNGTDITTGLWRSTAAITSVTIYPPAGNSLGAGTTISLYGIL